MFILQLKNLLFILLYIFVLSGCGSKVPTHTQRVQTANNIVNVDISKHIYSTKYFNLLTYSSSLATCKNKTTHIYIEGDGLAWITSSRISDDPTPINPVALKMFIQDDSTCKVYIARPCQYTNDQKCNKKYWTSHRFSKKVIQSYSEILDSLKEKYKLSKFNIIGYSGGGAIATIVSAKRNDIDKLITVAGNLDISFWARKHHVAPLHGSLNPADYAKQLENIEQYHLIGGKDKIIDKSIFESYVNKFKNKQNINYKVIDNFTHNCCWSYEWTILNL